MSYTATSMDWSLILTSVFCRTTLGFWAGHRNSKIRVILARIWENDTELDIKNNRINRATGHLVYQNKFYRTKFCICPGGSQVNSARIADSIHYGCVPGKEFYPFCLYSMVLYKLFYCFPLLPSHVMFVLPLPKHVQQMD